MGSQDDGVRSSDLRGGVGRGKGFGHHTGCAHRQSRHQLSAAIAQLHRLGDAVATGHRDLFNAGSPI